MSRKTNQELQNEIALLQQKLEEREITHERTKAALQDANVRIAKQGQELFNTRREARRTIAFMVNLMHTPTEG